MRKLILIISGLLFLCSFGVESQTKESKEEEVVVIETKFGNIVIELFDDFSKSMEARFEDFSKSIDARFEDFKGFVMGELARISKEIDEIRVDIRNINRRIDDLYQVVVRREEHYSLVEEVRRLRDDVEMLKRKVFQQ